MPINGLDHFNLAAPGAELEELRHFYCEVLGLTVGRRPRFASDGYWLYAGDHALVHLVVADDAVTAETDEQNTLNHVAFACSRREAFERRLEAAGVPFRRATVPDTRIHQLFVEDPAGNGIELNFGDG
jgi:catechol-2,3-dioxygenase